MDLLLILLLAVSADARMFCEKTKAPLELGEWRYDLKHMDSAVVENPPNSLNEGQVYVYENYFQNYTIKYIHVDNLAKSTCGASASIKAGGVGSSFVLIVLTARNYQEIRSVVDIWGKRTANNSTKTRPHLNLEGSRNRHLFRNMRVVSHNRPNTRHTSN